MTESSSTGRRERPLAVVVTMKTQLRGRIRRNVQTLLDLGAEVRVLTVDGRKDFFAGLDHPNLQVQYVEASSVLMWLNDRVRAASARRLAGRLVGQPPTQPPDAQARPVRRARVPAAAVRLDPAYRLVVGVRVAAYRARRRAGRLLREPARRYAAGRRSRLLWLRATLLPWHRVTRWVSFWRRSREAVLQLVPDLVVSSDLPGLVGASRAAHRLGVPHLHDCHELYLESTNLRQSERRLLWPVEKRYMRQADAVVVVNDSIAREYRRRYAVSSVVVRNCAQPQADGSVQDIRGLAGLPKDAHVVLYQGGFAPGRGLEVIISGAHRLPDGAWLVLLGDGAYRAELEALAASSAPDRVRFVDAVPPKQLMALTASATVGVVPYQPVSRNNELALPNKVFEYTVAGVPVVLADIPELRAIAVGHGCGQVYDPFDSEDFVRAVRQVVADGALETYRQASAAYGEDNSWLTEREILVREYLRIAPGIGLVDSQTRVRA